MRTAIVILNWNGEKFLREYLPGVVDSVKDCPGVEVIVADNASSDGSVAFLKNEFPAIKVIRLRKNHGFAEGYNRALKDLSHDCFLLLNSDVRVEPDWFEPLQEWMLLHEDCGICGPVLHQIADRDMFEYAGAAGGYLDRFCYPFCRGRVMGRIQRDELQYGSPADVMWVSGAALMVRSEVFFRMGGLCKEFFAHMEEIDFCWRVRLAGWRVCVVPRSTVFHLGGGSLGQDSPHKLYLNYRNNLLMMRRCLPYSMALNAAFATLSHNVDPNEGPDLIGLHTDAYFELDDHLRKEFAISCSEIGIFRAGITIFLRSVLDMLSACAYLLKGKLSYTKAVFRAHRDWHRMREKIDGKDIAAWLDEALSDESLTIAMVNLCENPSGQNLGMGKLKLSGLWSKSIIWQSLLKKDAIFADIKENLK